MTTTSRSLRANWRTVLFVLVVVSLACAPVSWVDDGLTPSWIIYPLILLVGLWRMWRGHGTLYFGIAGTIFLLVHLPFTWAAVFHGYVAVFQEDVIRHYQTHLAGRRAARPTNEYRPVTGDEWAEFEQHFDKRKVELGRCGRPYATPCEHEHACIRCPMLRIDPKMIDRLDEIHTDLLARREHAQTQSWLGAIDGIDLTLRFLADKRAETPRLAQLDTVTALGMPVVGART